MRLNHPKTIPPAAGPWKNCLARNWSLVLKSLGSAALAYSSFSWDVKLWI